MDAQAREHAWQQVRSKLEPRGWSVGESAAFHGFFCDGWRAAKAWEAHMASECQRLADEVDRLRAALEQIARLRGLQHPITMMIAEDRLSAKRIARDALHPPNPTRSSALKASPESPC